jgi:predicted HicB family RNase H-like nuclease
MAKQTTSLLVRVEPSCAEEVKQAAKRRGLSQNAWLSLAIRRILDGDLTAQAKK